MRHISFAIIASLICWAVCLSTVVEADVTILVDVTSLEALVGDNPAPVGSVLTTAMNSDSLTVDVLSVAYTGDDGNFAYLYQIENNGTAGDTAVEMFTLWPFSGANPNTRLGWLSTPNPVPGFQTGGVVGDDRAFVDLTPDAPMVSFYFTKRYADSIGLGEYSKLLYVLSQDSPSLIFGNVIGGTVGSGRVVGPGVIPEPGTFAYLLIGGLTALFARRRRR